MANFAAQGIRVALVFRNPSHVIGGTLFRSAQMGFGSPCPELRCVQRRNSRRNQLRNLGRLSYMGPRAATPESILAIGVVRGLVFGLGLSDFAAARRYIIFGSRSELVLVLGAPLGGGFDLPYRWFAGGVGFGRSG